jgi:hypothetical protein
MNRHATKMSLSYRAHGYLHVQISTCELPISAIEASVREGRSSPLMAVRDA